MKRILLSLMILSGIACKADEVASNTDFEKKLQIWEKELQAIENEMARDQRFVNRLRFKELELNVLAKECNESYHEEACLAIPTVIDAMKKDVLDYDLKPDSYGMSMLLEYYSSSHINCKELYNENADDVLAFYKQKMPEDFLAFLKSGKEKLSWARNACFIKHEESACIELYTCVDNENSLRQFARRFEEKLLELHGNNKELFVTVLDYLVESAAQNSANTKTKSLNSREELINFLKDYENIERIKMLIEGIKIAPESAFPDTRNMSLEEIREKFAENIEV